MILLKTRFHAISLPKNDWCIFCQCYYEEEDAEGRIYRNTTGVGDLLYKGDLLIDTAQNRYVFTELYDAVGITEKLITLIGEQISQENIVIDMEELIEQGFLLEKLEIFSKTFGGPPAVVYPPIY